MVAGLVVTGPAVPAAASHGGPVEGVVVDFTGLRPDRQTGRPEGCVVSGVVHNVSGRAVTIRIRYQGHDAARRPVSASARVVRVEPGESRDFTSSPFGNGDEREAVACGALARVEMVEAVADPSP